MRAIIEYAKRWDRDPHNNFAVACYNDCSVEDLASILIAVKNNHNTTAATVADPIDMKEWGISDSEEWLDAIQAASDEMSKELLNNY